MDFYRKMLNHFKWTWLESKKGHFHSGCGASKRKHEKMATKLARAYAKEQDRKDRNND
jgi:hypothetical protein